MDKQKYYISVQSKEIFSDPTIDEWEYEIEATENEVTILQELFNKMQEKDGDTFVPLITPYVPYHDDKPNDDYSDALIQTYRFIHRVGTPEAKEHIESMGMLGNQAMPDNTFG
ncbi:hydrolase [Ammoniphilus resinae]|uniref:Hydrolase n=1 Tax=Ammoniphilus resinae TaxID=861532 RepID=A0ABS4GLS9_9BACL|nr:hydrolase [Ammoniphilus resinae]MBP1931199.1 hypothetical protein [Ammoniphilus resinae]